MMMTLDVRTGQCSGCGLDNHDTSLQPNGLWFGFGELFWISINMVWDSFN